MAESDYGTRPCYGELIAVVLAGIGHIVIELVFNWEAGSVYNVAVSLSFLGYIIWRIRRTPGVMRIWGFRADNLAEAFIAQFKFVAVGVVALGIFAVFLSPHGLPVTFWLTLALYPIWGIAQQFALQNFIARNVAGFIKAPLMLAFVAAILFAISHYPRLELVGLTLVAGTIFTMIYRRHPNIWAVGTAHGLLGSMAYYIVLGEDPGEMILGLIGL